MYIKKTQDAAEPRRFFRFGGRQSSAGTAEDDAVDDAAMLSAFSVVLSPPSISFPGVAGSDSEQEQIDEFRPKQETEG